jgi:hypothetical protein
MKEVLVGNWKQDKPLDWKTEHDAKVQMLRALQTRVEALKSEAEKGMDLDTVLKELDTIATEMEALRKRLGMVVPT